MPEPEEPTALAASHPRPMLEALTAERRAAVRDGLVELLEREMGYFSGPQPADEDWTVLLDGGLALADVAETVLTSLASSAPGSWPDEAPDTPQVGWGYLRPGDRRVHFYDVGFSLCGRVGFYSGALTPEGSPPTPLDCKACTDRLATRNRRKNRS